VEQILEFMNNFIETEYFLSSARYDVSITTEDQDSMCYAKMKQFCHSVENQLISSYLRGKNDLTEKSLVKYRKAERVQKRLLFQIKKFQNPTYGDVYKRIVQDEFIYLCYAGHDQKNIRTEKPTGYDRLFVVADTKQLVMNSDADLSHTMEPVGLKIIKTIVMSEGKEFTGRGEMEQFRITDYGKLVDVMKIQAPEEEESLADYNES